MQSESSERTAPRLGPVLIALAIVVLIALLPRRYHLVPNWFAYLAATLMLLPMILVWMTQGIRSGDGSNASPSSSPSARRSS